jgi:hypothetical protein
MDAVLACHMMGLVIVVIMPLYSRRCTEFVDRGSMVIEELSG